MLKRDTIEFLRLIHISVLALVVFIILLHIISSSFLDFLRMPLFLRMIDPYIGGYYPNSFYLYHVALYFFFIVMLVDLLSLTFIRSRLLGIISVSLSLVGALVMAVLSIFFLYTVAVAGNDSFVIKGGITYFLVCGFLFVLDMATFITDEKMLKRK